MKPALGPVTLLLMAFAVGARAQATAPAGATTVQGVTVTARPQLTQTLLDRKVYAITQDLQATSGSAADVLDQVPSVSVDADGNPSLRGDPNVTILIDGKPSAQFAGATRGLSLQQLAASEIAKIEVLTNPPAQYKAEGSGGVINIITRKTRAAGLSGVAQLSVGDKRRYVFGLGATYNVGRLKLSGAVGLRQDARERVTLTNRMAVDPLTGQSVQSLEAIDEHTLRLIPSFKAGADYELNARQSIGASVSHRELMGGARFFVQHDASGQVGQAPTSVSQRDSNGHEWNVSNSAGLHFDQKLWRPNETLTLALQRSVTRERERYAYRNTFTLPPGPPTFDDLRPDLDLVKTELGADYDLPLAQGQEIQAGYDLEDDRNGFDNVGHTVDPATGASIVNPAVTNHFRYHQQVNALYGEYQRPLGSWRLQAGVRLEATRVSTLQITGDLQGGRHDFAAYPSLHLDRDIGRSGRLSASIGRRVTRPDPEALDPFSNHEDIRNLRAGNPNLLPQDTWLYELGYELKWRSLNFGTTAYYRFDRDAVTQVTQVVSADTVLITEANLPKSKSAGLEFSAGGKLGSKLSFTVSGDAFHRQIDARALGAPGLESTTGVNLKGSVDYRPTASDTVQISLSRSAARLTPQGSIGAINLVNVGYRRQLRPDLALVIAVSDLLSGQRFHRLTVTPQLRDDYLRHQLGPIALAGLVYTFGGQKKARPAEFEYDQ